MTIPKPNYEMETLREIWANDNDGEHVEVGPDRDGLRLVEIRLYNEKDIITGRLSFPPEMMRLIADAALKCAEEIEQANEQPY